MSAIAQYAAPEIAHDIDVIVGQIWNGAPKAKRNSGKIIEVDIAVAVTSIQTEDTIEGGSTLTLALVDNDWRLLDSGFFDPDKNGKLDPIEVNYPDGSRWWWRLANADVSSDLNKITLTFIERAVVLLMSHRGAKKVSRGSSTRAQFLKSLVAEVKKVKLEFICKELRKVQPIAAPDTPSTFMPVQDGGVESSTTIEKKSDDAKRKEKDPGIVHGSSIKIKGVKADDGQIDQINRSLGQADKDNAGPKARKALVVAGIGESDFIPQINAQGSNYQGVFQGSKDVFAVDDTEEMAHYFLVGGKGFQAGGAIKLAKENPGMSPGTIATKVEASGQPGSFYDKWGDEADAILEDYGSGGITSSSGGSTSTPYRKQFNYSRDKGEDSWEAMTRLAEVVKWPLFADGDRIYFDSDLTLIAQKPVKLVKRDAAEVISWGYTVALRRFASDFTITMICDPDEFRAGEVFKLAGFGMASKGKYKGAWLITNINRDRADIKSVFTLRLPITPELEPAPEIGQHTSDSDTATESSGPGAVGAYGLASMAPSVDPSAVATSGGGAYGAGRGYGGHAGVDISMPERTVLNALCSGTVACVDMGWYASSNHKGQGMISIKSDEKHGGFAAGTIFGYGHPDVIYKKKGDKVSAGEKIALSGAPGGGAHLHFFINTVGDACGNGDINPTQFAKDVLAGSNPNLTKTGTGKVLPV